MTILLEFVEGCYTIEEEFLQKNFPNGPLNTDIPNQLADIILKNASDGRDKMYTLLDKVKDHSYINKSNCNNTLSLANKINKVALQNIKEISQATKIGTRQLTRMAPYCINDHKLKEDYKVVKRLLEDQGNWINFWKDVSKEMKAIQVTCLNLK